MFGQKKSIVGQALRIDGDSLKIRFRMQNRWTKIAGTNGYSTSFMTDYIQDIIIGGVIDRTSTTTWNVLYSDHQLDIEARPLWKAESPNWDKWKNTKE